MAFLKTQSNRNDYNYKEYVIDTLDELETVPTDAAPGSVCLIINDKKVYMMNTQGEWKEFA